MNLLRPACAKPILLILTVVAVLILLASTRVMAEPWPIKHFEVVNVEPGGQGSTGGTAGEILGAIGRAAREIGIDPDATGGLKTITLLPKTKTDIETVLHLAATQMEQWGFSPPALEPVVVTKPDGIKRYRVYLAAKGASGRYHRNPCETLFRDERVMALDAEKVLDNGSLGIEGIHVLLHELFHAVQYGTPFFNHCNDNPVGSWITEGQADAVSWAITRQLRESAYKNLLEGSDSNDYKNRALVWGLRNYSNRLPVPEDINESYRTSSLWRFLSEVNASSVDVAAMPGIHSFDFSYLSRLLQTSPSARDCSTSGAPCAAEVQWLDSGLRSQFGKPLRELYTRFMQAYSLYGDGRLISSTVPDEKWLDSSFTYMDGGRKYKGCRTVSLSPAPDSLQQTMVIPHFKELSTQCWEVDLEGFDETHLSIGITTKLPAAPPPQPRLEQLTAALVDSTLTMDRAKVEPAAPDEPRRANWVYWFENNKKIDFLLTNVAKDAEATKALPNLEVTFTVLREYASMSAGESGTGPSPSDIDTPLPIEFDKLTGYAFPFRYRRIDDRYTGVDSMQGLAYPCVIKLGPFRNTENGDYIAFQMNHEGPVTPGDYVFSAEKKHPDEVHGGFVGGFSIGAGNPLSGGRQQDFYIESGRVTIDSVSAGLVRGHMEANGVRRNPYSGPNKFEKWGHLNLTIGVKFSILMKSPAGKRYINSPYACLLEKTPDDSSGGPGGSRRTSASASPGQGGTPPGNTQTPTGKDSPGSDGPANPPNETAAAPATDAAGAPVATAQPASSSDSGGSVPQPYVRRLVLRTTGGVESEVIMVDDDFKMTGGCNGTTPISLGFHRGQPNADDWFKVAFDTADVVGTGETGELTVKEIRWDHGTVIPKNLPPNSTIRVPNQFKGTGTLTLTTHIATLEQRKIAGNFRGEVTNLEGEQVSLEAEFDIDKSCGVKF